MADTATIVTALPECDIHKHMKGVSGVPALYDVNTRQRPSGDGPWAYACQECFDTYTPGILGVGDGQRLVLKGEVMESTAPDGTTVTGTVLHRDEHTVVVDFPESCLHPTESVSLRERESGGQVVFDWTCEVCGATGTNDGEDEPEVVEPCDHVGAGVDLASDGMQCRRCGALVDGMPL